MTMMKLQKQSMFFAKQTNKYFNEFEGFGYKIVNECTKV